MSYGGEALRAGMEMWAFADAVRRIGAWVVFDCADSGGEALVTWPSATSPHPGVVVRFADPSSLTLRVAASPKLSGFLAEIAGELRRTGA